MNIIIPMAEKGSRFSEAGYKNPKPLIDVNGKPMIARVIENLGMQDANHIFLILQEHEEILRPILEENCNNPTLVIVDTVTEGAACTALLAKEHIDNGYPLLMANCDQIMDWDREDFLYKTEFDIDGIIFTFRSDDLGNSYAKVNRHGYVTKVAEKELISNIATCGVYYWSQGRHFVKSAEQMIEKDIRINGEFYVCPTYNEMIENGLIINIHWVRNHHPIGTPDQLKEYLKAGLDDQIRSDRYLNGH